MVVVVVDMSDENDETDTEDIMCPLCTEPLDVTDKSINFCKCGYQLCLWCWHQIMETAAKDNVDGRYRVSFHRMSMKSVQHACSMYRWC